MAKELRSLLLDEIVEELTKHAAPLYEGEDYKVPLWVLLYLEDVQKVLGDVLEAALTAACEHHRFADRVRRAFYVLKVE